MFKIVIKYNDLRWIIKSRWCIGKTFSSIHSIESRIFLLFILMENHKSFRLLQTFLLLVLTYFVSTRSKSSKCPLRLFMISVVIILTDLF